MIVTRDKALSGPDVVLFRQAYGISQGRLGRLLGVSKQAVQGYERNGMSRAQALALAAIIAGLQPWQPSDAQGVKPKGIHDGE